jgi:guanyl-specific ribonuclease Sa
MEELLEKIHSDKDFKIQIADSRYHKIGNFVREKKSYGNVVKKFFRKIKPKYKPALQVFAEHVYEKSCEAFEIVYEKECDEKEKIIFEDSLVITENSLDLKEKFSDNEVVIKISDLSLTCAGCAIECARLKNFEAGFNFLGLAKCSAYVAKKFAEFSLYVGKKSIEGLELGCKDVGLLFKNPKKYFSVDNFNYDEICKEISNFIALVKKDKLKASGEIAKFLTRTFLNVGFWTASYFYVLTPLAAGMSATGSAIANLATELFSTKVASVVGGAAAVQPTNVVSGVAEKVTTVVGAAAQAIPVITSVGQQIIESVLAFAVDGSGGGGSEIISSLENNVPRKVYDTLDTINKTGSAPDGFRGGRRFINDGRNGGQVLPRFDENGEQIIYKEWDVNPYQRSVSRGVERLVTGSDGSAFYTNDHYNTFVRIK